MPQERDDRVWQHPDHHGRTTRATGLVSYSYTLTDNEVHPSGGGNNNLFEDFAVTLVDSDGDSANNTLSVRIVDRRADGEQRQQPGRGKRSQLGAGR
ncbi:hypothetical protein [Aeromonas salmonicida]|uniref:hypothetical protein n=1 Tax=Aeromonas salmonicida TaxID=645 RepID=UPI001F5EEFF2|nr:hypothetical protein [Aeromonas salmonicida]